MKQHCAVWFGMVIDTITSCEGFSMKINVSKSCAVLLSLLVVVSGVSARSIKVTDHAETQSCHTIPWSSAKMQGDRDYMQDVCDVITLPTPMANARSVGPRDGTFACLCDGHGERGDSAADTALRMVLNSFKGHRWNNDWPFSDWVKDNIAYACKGAEQLLELNSFADSGTTCVCAWVGNDGMVRLAHVGDSRAVVCDTAGNVIAQTNDHTMKNEAERVRVGADKAAYVWGKRVNGLIPTRVFGDLATKRGGNAISANPEVSAPISLDDGGYVILASDGVWDVMSSQEAAQFVVCACAEDNVAETKKVQLRNGKTETMVCSTSASGETRLLRAAQELCKQAYERGSTDNISAQVLYVKSKK